MSVEKILGKNVVQRRHLPDGTLEIRSHISDAIQPGKTMYTMFFIKEKGFGAVQFSHRHFEDLTLEGYRTYFEQIENYQDFLRLSEAYNTQEDART